MNTIFRYTAMLGALLLAASSFAQQTKVQGQRQSLTKQESLATTGGGLDYLMSAGEMTRVLGLDQSQSEKLMDLEAGLNKELLEAEKMDSKERDAKVKELVARHRRMVASVLTPEQNKQLEVISSKRAQERRAGKELKTAH